MADTSNFDLILDALQQYPGRKKDASGWKMVVCPFHGDSDPSCGINLKLGGRYPLGFFHCLGCGEKGGWNKFAAKTGLTTIKEWRSNEEDSVSTVFFENESSMLGEMGTLFREVLVQMDCLEAQQWPADLDWRGYSGELVRAVGGHIINDDYSDSVAVLFPIKVGGKVRGGVKAVYQKAEGEKGRLGYVAMKGDWVKSYGLFPYVYSKSLVERNNLDYLVLVEGPRDALRLVNSGVPALAILGSRNFSKTKATFVLGLGVDRVFVMTDNDQGGNAMWAIVRKVFSGLGVTPRRVKLPPESEIGKKIDPGNMPASYLRQLKTLVA